MDGAKDTRWKQVQAYRARERRRLKRLESHRGPNTASEDVRFSNEEMVKAPRQFSLEDSWHDDVADFLAELRAAFKRVDKAVAIDFRPTNRVIAGATLLLFSEIQRLKEIYPERQLRCVPSRDDTVNQALQHLGIYAMLGYKSGVVPTRRDVVNWSTASASFVDGTRVGTLIDTFSTLKGDIAKQLFRGATEAMLNSMNHAYLSGRNDGLPQPPTTSWWMFCREEEDTFFVAVCDLGIGIPRSLPLKYPTELINAAMRVLSRGRKKTDARMIQAAMELARTRTDRRGRGLGLHDLKRIVDQVAGGALYIFSNRGVVTYRNRGFIRKNFNSSIKGTVVVWIIPLGGN